MANRVLKIVGFLAFCGFLLLAFEGLYRFYLFGWHAFSYPRVNSVFDFGRGSGLVQASPHKDLIYELKPDLDTWHKLVPLRTNSHGMRDREYPVEKPAGTFRIAAVGDSFTVPSGVKIEDAYHTVLEDRLNAERPEREWEALNFGVGGYSLRQYLGTMRAKALAFDPDLVLVGYCAENDHQSQPPWAFDTPYVPLPTSSPFFDSFALRTVKMAFAERRRRIRYGLTVEPIEIRRNQRDYIDRAFSFFARFRDRHDVPVVIAFLSNRPRDPRVVARLARRHDLPFVDVTTSFEGTDLRDYIIYPIDGHPNAEAHKIFADRIYDYLIASSLLPSS